MKKTKTIALGTLITLGMLGFFGCKSEKANLEKKINEVEQPIKKINLKELKQDSILLAKADSIKQDSINKYWKSKTGYNFSICCEDKKTGIKSYYSYDVLKNWKNVEERMIIRNGKIKEYIPNSSHIAIYESNHDTLPEKIYFEDIINNTNLTIENDSGKISYESNIEISEKEVKEIYKIYSEIFNEFKNQSILKKGLKEHKPKLEIHTIYQD